MRWSQNVVGGSSQCRFPRVYLKRAIIFLHLCPGKWNWQLMRSLTELDKQSPGKHPERLTLCLACQMVSPPTAHVRSYHAAHKHCECHGSNYCDTLAQGPWLIPDSVGFSVLPFCKAGRRFSMVSSHVDSLLSFAHYWAPASPLYL